MTTIVKPDYRILGTSGRGIAVRGNDIDTDAFVPAHRLKEITFENMGKYLFEQVIVDWQAEGKIHPFADPKFQGAQVLFVNKNFGCGSSREHAPQAVKRWGIKACIGESFAEIYFGNCTALGVPCITLPSEDILAIMSAVEADPLLQITVDLGSEESTAINISVGREDFLRGFMPEGARRSLITGRWDSLLEMLEGEEEIRNTRARLAYRNGFPSVA